ncbi:MAG TPA: hypothetical protein VNQ77_07075 [Frankiaceae bacterium]|nr:hypothetical protein [Frankiaceae bacterium]
MGFLRRDAVADLAQRADVPFALLANGEWKKRGVEEITIGSAQSVESRRSFQCADLGDALGSLRPRGATHASVVLPLTTLPKRPLLGFDVSAPDRTVANLPPRGALAELEAGFVCRLADAGGIRVDDTMRLLITKICEFSPGRWTRWYPDLPYETRVAGYVESQTGWRLADDVVKQWLDAVAPARASLADAVGLPPDPDSSAENPVLVVPLVQAVAGIGPDDVLPLLRRYARFVERCTALDHVEPFAPHAMLAEYGRVWEVMIECTVPLDGPFIVRMSERRSLNLSGDGVADLEVTTGDALSNHTVVRVIDENVCLGKPDAIAIDGSPLREDEFDSVRFTAEEVATYASGPDREYRIKMQIPLTVVGHVGATNTVVAALTLLSIVLVLRGWSAIDAADLAVLVIPTTFAASLAVTRERTTLASHLMGRSRLVVLVLTTLLWVLVGAHYLGDTEVSRAGCASISVTPPGLAEPQDLRHERARRCDGQEHR